jgi:hypothetical protein
MNNNEQTQTVDSFIELIENECMEISLLCTKHILNKLHKDKENITREEVLETFSNYKNFVVYLNDFAGVIYRRYTSSVDEIYIDICKAIEIEWDNEYLFNHRVAKIAKIDIRTIISLDDDFKMDVIEKYQRQIDVIMRSKFYNENPSRQAEVLKIKNSLI